MREQRIKAECNFVIYGAATTGAIMYRNLIEQGYRVSCFLDRRYDEIHSYLDLPVRSVKDFTQEEDKNIIIIIAIKNVFAHEDIASQFVDQGFHYIVYKSLDLIKGEPAQKDMLLGKIYDDIFSGKVITDVCIPATQSTGFAAFEDSTQRETNNEFVYAKIPAAFVFSDKYEDTSIIWNAVNIMGLISHLDFFKCIQGDTEKCYDDYLTYCYAAAERSGGILTSDRWAESVLENRINVYQNMELEEQFNPYFFDESAPLATLNENGVFNIHSGKHRMIYQVINGRMFLTLKLSKKDYMQWKNAETAQAIYQYLQEHRIRKLEVPIMNPYFYKFPCDNMMFYYHMQKEVVNCIYRYFYQKKKSFPFEEYKVYNNGIQGLVLNPVLIKMGFFVYSENDVLEGKKELKELLYQLYGVSNQLEQEKPQILITDKKEMIKKYKNSEVIFAVLDYEESLEMISGFYKAQIISSGFCNNKRKKVAVWIRE